ncbi:hypothetical protein GEMRC1_006095 [Eukaryota sp. GEM-RC1]
MHLDLDLDKTRFAPRSNDSPLLTSQIRFSAATPFVRRANSCGCLTSSFIRLHCSLSSSVRLWNILLVWTIFFGVSWFSTSATLSYRWFCVFGTFWFGMADFTTEPTFVLGASSLSGLTRT